MKKNQHRRSIPIEAWQSDRWELPMQHEPIASTRGWRTINLKGAVGLSRRSKVKPAPGPRLSVLVVDDSAIVRERLRALLADGRCVGQVNEAANGAEAWTLFQLLAPDAILLDIQLPDRAGFEVLRRIKRATPACLVIVLTNLRDPIFRQEAQRRGADHFLHKATEFERVTYLLDRYADSCKRNTANICT